MSLQEYRDKIKPQANIEDIHFDERGEAIRFHWLRRVWLTVIIILAMTLSFGLGRLSSVSSNQSIKIDYVDVSNNQSDSNTVNSQLQTTNSSVIVSSKGTKYYYSWCGNNISEKNMISFASAVLAERAGYTLAANCSPR